MEVLCPIHFVGLYPNIPIKSKQISSDILTEVDEIVPITTFFDSMKKCKQFYGTALLTVFSPLYAFLLIVDFEK